MQISLVAAASAPSPGTIVGMMSAGSSQWVSMTSTACVQQLARRDAHLPTLDDIANFEADAPVRLVERVIRNSRPSLQQALDQPGREVPVTDSPPPKAYFRIDGDWLWVRVVMYEGGRLQLMTKQLAAVQGRSATVRLTHICTLPLDASIVRAPGSED